MKGSIRQPRTPGGTWAYRIDSEIGRDGRRGQRQVAGFASREDAEAALADALAAQGGGDPRTVAGFLERVWLPAKRSEVERSTFDQYAWAVRRHIVPVLGRLKLVDIQPAPLEAWLGRLGRSAPEAGGAPLGRSSVRLVRKVLSMACGDALEQGHLGENPLRFVQPPEPVEPDRVGWTAEERRRFLAAAAAHRLGAAFVLVLATGLRRGEVLALGWSDLDLGQGRLRVAGQLVVEGGRPRMKPLDAEHGGRVMPLGRDITRVLARHRRAQDGERLSAGEHWHPSDLGFATPTGDWVAPERFASILDDLIAMAGVRRVTSEGLRRTALSKP